MANKISLFSVLILSTLIQTFSVAAQTSDDALAVGVAAIPARLDPLTDRGDGPGLLAAACDTLIGLGRDGALVPGLAREWRFDADARGLTLELRTDRTFPDGEPVDADAVAASLGRMTGDARSQRRAELAPVAAIEVRGRHTVYLRLDRAYVPIAARLTGRAGMVTQDIAEDSDVPCAGPYRVQARRGEGMLELARDPSADDAGYSRVRVVAVGDPALRLARVRSGALDLAGDIAPADAAEAANEGRVRIVAAADPGAVAILFNLKRGPRAAARISRDIGARVAFAAALDLKALAGFSGAGFFVPFEGTAPPPAARPAPFELTVPGDAMSLALAAEIAKQAAAAAIAVKLRARDPARAELDVQNGDFEAALVRVPSRPDPDMHLQPMFHCAGAANDSGYCDPTTDDMLDRARAETDPVERAGLYAHIETRLRENLPAIFLFRPARLVAAGPRAAGFEASADGGWRFSAIRR